MVALFALSGTLGLAAPAWLPPSFDTSEWLLADQSRREVKLSRASGEALTLAVHPEYGRLVPTGIAAAQPLRLDQPALGSFLPEGYEGTAGPVWVNVSMTSGFEGVRASLVRKSPLSLPDQDYRSALMQVEAWTREALSSLAATRLTPEGIAAKSGAKMVSLDDWCRVNGLEYRRAPTGIITLEGKSTTAHMALGSREIEIAGSRSEMPDVPMLKDGRLWIPLAAAERLRLN